MGQVLVGCASATGQPTTPSATTVQSSGEGLGVTSGFVGMNGRTEVTCALTQRSDDQVSFRLTVRSECATTGRLEVQMELRQPPEPLARPPIGTFLLAQTLEPGVQEVKLPPLPLPPANTLVLTEMSATCVGLDARRIWSRTQCRVPE